MQNGNEHRLWDGKRWLANIYFLKNVLKQLLFLEIVSVMKINKNCLYVCVQSGGGGRSN